MKANSVLRAAVAASFKFALIAFVSAVSIGAGFWLSVKDVRADEVDDAYRYCRSLLGTYAYLEDCVDEYLYNYDSGGGYYDDGYYDDGYYDDGYYDDSYSGYSPYNDGSSYSGSYGEYLDNQTRPACPGVHLNGACVCAHCAMEFAFGSLAYEMYSPCSQKFDDTMPDGRWTCGAR